MSAVHLHKYYEEKIFNKLNIINILDKYSHSKHDECLLDSTPATQYGYKLDHCENVTKIIETINGEYRCFTYFLLFDYQLIENNRNDKQMMHKGEIEDDIDDIDDYDDNNDDEDEDNDYNVNVNYIDKFMTSIFISSKTFERRTNKV